MSNEQVKVSGLPTLSQANSSTKLVVSHTYPNGVVNSFILPISNSSSFIPGPFANDAVANSNGVGVKSLYYDSTGIVHIRLT